MSCGNTLTQTGRKDKDEMKVDFPLEWLLEIPFPYPDLPLKSHWGGFVLLQELQGLPCTARH